MVTVRDINLLKRLRNLRKIKRIKPKHIKNTVFEFIEDIIGDGACFTNSIASFLTGDQKNGIKLKRDGHNYLVSNWINYFKEYNQHASIKL